MFQKRGGRGKAPAGLRSSRGSLQFGGDFFARLGSPVRSMPCSAVRIQSGISHLRQHTVGRAAFADRSGPVRCRTHQRVTEGYPHTDFEQPGLLGRFRCTRPDPEPPGSIQQKRRITERLRRREQEESLGVMRQSAEPSKELFLDLSRQRPHARQPEPAR